MQSRYKTQYGIIIKDHSKLPLTNAVLVPKYPLIGLPELYAGDKIKSKGQQTAYKLQDTCTAVRGRYENSRLSGRIIKCEEEVDKQEAPKTEEGDSYLTAFKVGRARRTSAGCHSYWMFYKLRPCAKTIFVGN